MPCETLTACPALVPETGPIFGCASWDDCSANFRRPSWFGTQEQYVSDDFSKMMIITAAELSLYAYKFTKEGLDDSKNTI